MRNIFIAAAVGLAALGGTLYAGEVLAEDKAEAVVVGTNYCLGCTLKSEEGAHAQCSIYGHRHGLRVETATVGGESVGLAGETLHYLDNEHSAPLVQGEGTHGARVEVHGRLFQKANLIDVSSFEVEKASP